MDSCLCASVRAVPEWVSVQELVLACPLHWSATRTPTMTMGTTITTTTTTTTTKQTYLQLLRLSTISTIRGGIGSTNSNWCRMASPLVFYWISSNQWLSLSPRFGFVKIFLLSFLSIKKKNKNQQSVKKNTVYCKRNPFLMHLNWKPL